MDIICMGLTVCDIIVKPTTPELFEHDSTAIERVTIMPGGDACNVAINAAAIGMKTAVVSAVGDDNNGIYIRSYLKDHHVDISGVITSKHFGTATSVVMVEPSGERHFLTNTEIFQDLLPGQVTRELLQGAKVLSMNSCYRLPNLDDGGVVPAFELAHEMGVLTAMDTAWNRQGSWLGRIEKTLYHTDIFLPSYNEAVQITGTKNVREMRKILKKYGLSVFGVKMGGEGSYVTDFKNEYFIKPFQVKEVVNTVGAGDSYVSGFLCAQIIGMNLYDSAVFASAAAAYTVQTIGAVGGVPSAEVLLHYIEMEKSI